MERVRSRQIEDVETNADPVDVTLCIPQPKACDIYYACCGKIDQHNRCRQDSLDLEKKMGTHFWDKRANFGIFGMCVVDAWLCFKNTVKTGMTQEDFYMTLAEELIDNDIDSIRLRRRRGGGEDGESSRVVGNDGRPKDSDGIHVTHIAKNMSGKNKNHTIQLRCKICSKKTTNQCSQCDPSFAVCSSRTGRDCFRQHYEQTHV